MSEARSTGHQLESLAVASRPLQHELTPMDFKSPKIRGGFV